MMGGTEDVGDAAYVGGDAEGAGTGDRKAPLQTSTT